MPDRVEGLKPMGAEFAAADRRQYDRGHHCDPAIQMTTARSSCRGGMLRPLFERWYPGLASDNTAGTSQAAAA